MKTQELFPLPPIAGMRALSWKEPFASLMLHGKIETRTWSTKYRGLVLICASKQSYTWEQVISISGKVQFERMAKALGGFPDANRPGHAIAVGHLTYCRPMEKEDSDRCFVQYRPDLFCHIYTNVRAIEPIPWKGSQGWGIVSDHIQAQITYL